MPTLTPAIWMGNWQDVPKHCGGNIEVMDRTAIGLRKGFTWRRCSTVVGDDDDEDDCTVKHDECRLITEHGWAGRCPSCHALHWFDSGYVIYWADCGCLKGWAGWHSIDHPSYREHDKRHWLGSEACRQGCTVADDRSVCVRPVPWSEQAAYYAMRSLGGMQAILDLLDKHVTRL